MFEDLALVLEQSASMQKQACADASAFLDGFEARERQRNEEWNAAFAEVRTALEQAISNLTRPSSSHESGGVSP